MPEKRISNHIQQQLCQEDCQRSNVGVISENYSGIYYVAEHVSVSKSRFLKYIFPDSKLRSDDKHTLKSISTHFDKLSLDEVANG